MPTSLPQLKPPEFYFNNSALQVLGCGRQYFYTYILGLKSPGKNQYLTLGSVFHEMMERVGRNGESAFTFLFTNKPKHLDKLEPKTANSLAHLAQKVYDENPHWFTEDHKRELFCTFADPDAELVDPTLKLDLITYNQREDCIDIRDYKTTSKPLDGKFFQSYSLLSQRPFYIYHLHKGADLIPDLPPHWRAALRELRIRFGYVFVNYEQNIYSAEQLTYVDEAFLRQMAELFHEKKLIARAIQQDNSLAVKDGIATGLCWKCPYAFICSNHNEEKEKQLVEKWPYGRAPYDPEHKED